VSKQAGGGKSRLMEFSEAISALKNGDQVRREGWMPGAAIAASAADLPIQSLIDGKLSESLMAGSWRPKLSDFLATDWEIHVPRPAPAAVSAA